MPTILSWWNCRAAACRSLPLDFLQVRKLGVPGQPEYAMGAVAADGTCSLRRDVIDELGITEQAVAMTTANTWQVILRRERHCRAVCPALALQGRVVILVDDGLATGSTMHAAVQAVQAARQRQPARIVVAVPVGAAETCRALRPEVDALICPLTLASFRAVGSATRGTHAAPHRGGRLLDGQRLAAAPCFFR